LDDQRILVVDDDPSILDVISMALQLAGYSTETATNGLEALEAVERLHPALVVLDMRMPVLDGWGFARELRTRGIHLPILVVTAAQDAGQWAAEIGADGVLPKPFDIMELLSSVGRLQTVA
jgi:CheY-like chemotaxis protein